MPKLWLKPRLVARYARQRTDKMPQKTEFTRPKIWFRRNLRAVPTGWAGGNCSACIFRGDMQYCNKLACLYMPDSDDIESVYWVSRETHASIGLWPELTRFFDTVPKQKIRDISSSVVTQAVLESRQKAK